MATNFLEAAGTGGFITGATTVAWTSALTGLGSNAGRTSTTVFSQATFANAKYLQAWFINGSGTWTPVAGGCLSFYWVLSPDGGSTFEPNTAISVFPRAPDFTVPFDGALLSSGAIRFCQRPFFYPYVSAKLLVINNSGIGVAISGTPSVLIGGVTEQY